MVVSSACALVGGHWPSGMASEDKSPRLGLHTKVAETRSNEINRIHVHASTGLHACSKEGEGGGDPLRGDQNNIGNGYSTVDASRSQGCPICLLWAALALSCMTCTTWIGGQ